MDQDLGGRTQEQRGLADECSTTRQRQGDISTGGCEWFPDRDSFRDVYLLNVFSPNQKLDLPSLRQRAFQHIISQLTIHNIPYEVFSQFSATYEEVRKVRDVSEPGPDRLR